MKYIVTENQNERIIKLIKQFADTYTEDGIVRTDVEVEYSAEKNLYVLYPIFYIKRTGEFPYQMYKHRLAQKVQNYTGFPVHSASARVKVIKNEI